VADERKELEQISGNMFATITVLDRDEDDRGRIRDKKKTKKTE
jgi:hypothetical protein